ncbi:MAG TPA: putative quinol monooxygenase [Polyangia bacterium]
MPDNFHCLHVQIHVKPDAAALEAFRAATEANASASVGEPGVVRFDVFQDQDDPTRFVLVEVYRSADAHASHRTTAHYQAWRAAVDGLMAEPRTARKFFSVSPPPTDDAW